MDSQVLPELEDMGRRFCDQAVSLALPALETRKCGAKLTVFFQRFCYGEMAYRYTGLPSSLWFDDNLPTEWEVSVDTIGMVQAGIGEALRFWGERPEGEEKETSQSGGEKYCELLSPIKGLLNQAPTHIKFALPRLAACLLLCQLPIAPVKGTQARAWVTRAAQTASEFSLLADQVRYPVAQCRWPERNWQGLLTTGSGDVTDQECLESKVLGLPESPDFGVVLLPLLYRGQFLGSLYAMVGWPDPEPEDAVKADILTDLYWTLRRPAAELAQELMQWAQDRAFGRNVQRMGTLAISAPEDCKGHAADLLRWDALSSIIVRAVARTQPVVAARLWWRPAEQGRWLPIHSLRAAANDGGGLELAPPEEALHNDHPLPHLQLAPPGAEAQGDANEDTILNKMTARGLDAVSVTEYGGVIEVDGKGVETTRELAQNSREAFATRAEEVWKDVKTRVPPPQTGTAMLLLRLPRADGLFPEGDRILELWFLGHHHAGKPWILPLQRLIREAIEDLQRETAGRYQGPLAGTHILAAIRRQYLSSAARAPDSDAQGALNKLNAGTWPDGKLRRLLQEVAYACSDPPVDRADAHQQVLVACAREELGLAMDEPWGIWLLTEFFYAHRFTQFAKTVRSAPAGKYKRSERTGLAGKVTAWHWLTHADPEGPQWATGFADYSSEIRGDLNTLRQVLGPGSSFGLSTVYHVLNRLMGAADNTEVTDLRCLSERTKNYGTDGLRCSLGRLLKGAGFDIDPASAAPGTALGEILWMHDHWHYPTDALARAIKELCDCFVQGRRQANVQVHPNRGRPMLLELVLTVSGEVTRPIGGQNGHIENGSNQQGKTQLDRLKDQFHPWCAFVDGPEMADGYAQDTLTFWLPMHDDWGVDAPNWDQVLSVQFADEASSP